MTMEDDKRREDELTRIREARERYNAELDETWGREHRTEAIREGHGEGHGHNFERTVLAELKAISEVLLIVSQIVQAVLQQVQGGAKLAFRLILKQGDGPMATIQIASIQRVGGTTGVMTSTPHGLNVGDSFAISGVSDPTLNVAQGTAVVAASGFGPSNFTFTQAGADTAVATGGTLTTAATGGGTGTGVVGTPSTFGLSVVDQTGAVQPLPAGVTPSVAVVDGNGGTSGASASLSSDNSTVTVTYTAAGTYTLTVSDSTGKVASASATVVVAAGTPPQTLSFKLTQTS